jgi:hypothetical protein
VLKCRHERRTAGSGTETTDTSGGSEVSGEVCEQRYAAERILPQSGFELQHAGSPSEEATVEEEEKSVRADGQLVPVGLARGVGRRREKSVPFSVPLKLQLPRILACFGQSRSGPIIKLKPSELI